ncbi:MAG TPA: isoprenylcysteine carboxylmethyltransferase family protein [Candidatus Binataceae bacterium]|nr:isoprenylcysteine carboxylmethyltransferase family protein [Candidatus Binataceae bacterium]
MPFWKSLVSAVVQPVLFGAMLFLPAGTLHWWRAWVFLATVLVASLATMFGVIRLNPELLNERYKSPVQRGQPLSDRIVLLALLVSFAGDVVFIPLDVFRFELFGRPGLFVSSLGLALFVAGWTVITLAFKENTFAAPVVKYQSERHQKVIDSGVYRFVRHPMYGGAVLIVIGQALWLESYAAAVFALVPIVVLAVRVLIEERFLRGELSGYEAYTEKTRYRMIPFVW